MIEKHRRPDSLVSSNTSTIPLTDLTSEMSPAFRRDFAIIHFFNPPRTMRLVELVGGTDTSPDTVAQLTRTVERQLGKVVLPCRDTPGFIANRIGNLWMAAGAREALDNDIPLELADALFSRPVGIPRTGIFGLFDYIGLQLVPGIWGVFLYSLSTLWVWVEGVIKTSGLFPWCCFAGMGTSRLGFPNRLCW